MALKGLFIETLGKASILLPHTNSSPHCFLNPLKPLLSLAELSINELLPIHISIP